MKSTATPLGSLRTPFQDHPPRRVPKGPRESLALADQAVIATTPDLHIVAVLPNGGFGGIHTKLLTALA